MTRDQFKQQLLLEEGRRKFPYKDQRGKLTIGVGWNLTDRGLPDDVIDLLLERSISNAAADCEREFPWFKSLDDTRAWAMVDLCFNLGASKILTFTTFVSLMAQGKYPAAAHDLMTTLWAHEIQPSRADRIFKAILNGDGGNGKSTDATTAPTKAVPGVTAPTPAIKAAPDNGGTSTPVKGTSTSTGTDTPTKGDAPQPPTR